MFQTHFLGKIQQNINAMLLFKACKHNINVILKLQ
jgi:hypothetical protein